MRGEHQGRAVNIHLWQGSSPRARGARPLPAAHDDLPRIIPACAGSTVRVVFGHPLRADHPRVRGEHAEFAGRSCYQSGSSPRARGAHLMTSEYISPHRKTASLCASASQPAASASLRAVTSSRRPHELYLRLNFRRFSRRFHTASELMPEARLEPGGFHRLNEGAAPAASAVAAAGGDQVNSYAGSACKAWHGPVSGGTHGGGGDAISVLSAKMLAWPHDQSDVVRYLTRLVIHVHVDMCSAHSGLVTSPAEKAYTVSVLLAKRHADAWKCATCQQLES